MKLKNAKKFKVWSNAFYLVPVALALHWHVWVTAFLILCVILSGVLYHLSREKRFGRIDNAFALALIASNGVICYLGHFLAPYFWIAFLFVLLSFFYHFYLQKKDRYDLNHGLWHMYGSLITMFCIFTYVFGR